MTRKELEQIEEWCREEMQEQIPDKEDLWQRIEAGLPEQGNAGVSGQITVSWSSEKNSQHKGNRTGFRRGLTVAACLLLVAGGVRIWQNKGVFNSADDVSHDIQEATNALYSADADADADADYHTETKSPVTQSNMLHYTDLAVPENRKLRDSVSFASLGTPDAYFNEAEVLAGTEVFIDVQVLQGIQNTETGVMQYVLKIMDSYGAQLQETELIVTTRSAYLLEEGHEYVLPVRQGDACWQLAYECAPQIEKTQDNQLLLHNGWQSVIYSGMDCTPVLCDSYGQEDYFYDRMYLTGDAAIGIIMQQWKNEA